MRLRKQVWLKKDEKHASKHYLANHDECHFAMFFRKNFLQVSRVLHTVDSQKIHI